MKLHTPPTLTLKVYFTKTAIRCQACALVFIVKFKVHRESRITT